MVYEPRHYRTLHKEGELKHFQIVMDETDLDLAIRRDDFKPHIIGEVQEFIKEQRSLLKEYIKRDPEFQRALKPHHYLSGAPPSVVEMCEASFMAGVGPMAAVAGWFSQNTGKLLNKYSPDVVVENGGDIWVKSAGSRIVGIYAGQSPFSHQVGLKISSSQTPLGICTSSGTVGHSLSFGRADAVVVMASSAVLADAVATAACNLVQGEETLETAVGFALAVPGITGALAILGKKMAAQGQIELVSLE